jgi:hypothetical protein
MTPEQTETVALEAKAWKGKDGRRAMTMLDVELEKGERLHLTPPSVRSGNFWAACRATARWTQIPDALAVEFLKARARDVARANGRMPYPDVDDWRVALSTMIGEFPTESHALISAVLASKESR